LGSSLANLARARAHVGFWSFASFRSDAEFCSQPAAIADVDECTLLLLLRVRPISLGRRLRLRGPRGAQDVFVLAAIAHGLSLVARPLPPGYRYGVSSCVEDVRIGGIKAEALNEWHLSRRLQPDS
jgi:hypothetical protein